MISKKSTRKQFTAMFCQAMKPASIMAILAFVCFLFFTVASVIAIDLEYYPVVTGFFFDELRADNMFNLIANAAFVGAGVVNAMLLFNFAWSKKQSNVVLSLGMKKSDIYFSKILGGLVPMAGAILAAGLVETIANVTNNFELNTRFFVMAFLVMLSFFAVYALSFILTSAVMANVGNAIEGLIFTALLSVFSMTLKAFFANSFWQLTHGAYLEPSDQTVTPWNWSHPFFVFYNFEDDLLNSYFDLTYTSPPTVKHWSGVIMAAIYAVVIILLGYLGFKKRRNEICGTWGRAKGMNEIVGAVTGFYATYVVAFGVLGYSHGNANFLTYLAGCGAFVVTYIIFKLIFGYKRKKEVKASLNRFPVYAMGFAAVCLVFSLGLFGYSSELPEVSEIASVSVNSPIYKFMEDGLSASSTLALQEQSRRNFLYSPQIDGEFYSDSSAEFPKVTFTNQSEIAKVLDLHKSIIEDGKIKNNGAHSCATNVIIVYTLKDGTQIKRFYTETAEGTAKKLISLNDTDAVGDRVFEYMNLDKNFELYRAALTGQEESVIYEGEYNADIKYYLEEHYLDNEFYNNKSTLILTQPCYLFPKDMSKGYNIGLIEEELYKAIATDIKKISSQGYYHHSAEDEIGVLSFGLSNSDFVEYYYQDATNYGISSGVVYAETYDEPQEDDKTIDNVGSYATTSWNLNSFDIKTLVLTKDMVNTIAYLEEHDMMKYFESNKTASDIKSVRLATMSELYGEDKNSDNFPIFCAGYWTAEQTNSWLTNDDLYYTYYFENIHNEITDQKQIEELLDSAVLYGFCSNDSRIMEITYEDGSVATVMIAAS